MEPISTSEQTVTHPHGRAHKAAGRSAESALFDKLFVQIMPTAEGEAGEAGVAELLTNGDATQSGFADLLLTDGDAGASTEGGETSILALLAQQTGTPMVEGEEEPLEMPVEVVALAGEMAVREATVGEEIMPEMVAVSEDVEAETEADPLVEQLVGLTDETVEDVAPEVPVTEVIAEAEVAPETVVTVAPEVKAQVAETNEPKGETEETAEIVATPDAETAEPPEQVVAAAVQAPQQTARRADAPVAAAQTVAQQVAAPQVKQANAARVEQAKPATAHTVTTQETVSDDFGEPAESVEIAAPKVPQRPSRFAQIMENATEVTHKTVTAEQPKAQPMPAVQVDVGNAAAAEPTSMTDTTQTENPDVQPLDMTAPGWEDQLATQIEAEFTEDGGNIDIALTPDNLGTLRIRLEMRDGAAHVTVLTDNEQAARLFNQSEGRLSELLSKSGLSLTGQNASADPRGGQNNAGQRGQNGPSGHYDNGNGQQTDDAGQAQRQQVRGLVNLVA
ncbi:hypothetical protein HCZ30_00380 [Marivivens donghaensis]|uniref:Flagellar hook-length control protein-like C-terminal domain-containing protein n=1 Tax=Marivivens donghaensis TaxID=1699413 RepID=A0ABX0VU09_9RHOB|nr:flagellar hook-length control protein FliK [Marivivens donghaensis]NIY70885.1 hypothetical protein [Marivivens donghaensis]